MQRKRDAKLFRAHPSGISWDTPDPEEREEEIAHMTFHSIASLVRRIEQDYGTFTQFSESYFRE